MVCDYIEPAVTRGRSEARAFRPHEIRKLLRYIEVDGIINIDATARKFAVVAPCTKRREEALNLLHISSVGAVRTCLFDTLSMRDDIPDDSILAPACIHAQTAPFLFDLGDVWQLTAGDVRASEHFLLN